MLADVHLNITVAQCYHCSNSCIFLSIVYLSNVATEEANMYLFLGQHFILKKIIEILLCLYWNQIFWESCNCTDLCLCQISSEYLDKKLRTSVPPKTTPSPTFTRLRASYFECRVDTALSNFLWKCKKCNRQSKTSMTVYRSSSNSPDGVGNLFSLDLKKQTNKTTENHL